MADEPNVLRVQMSDGTEYKLRGWRAAERWFDKLQDAWSWMEPRPEYHDQFGIRGNSWSHILQIGEAIAEGGRGGHDPANYSERISNLARAGWGPLSQDSEAGQRILQIKDEVSDEAALFGWGILKEVISLRSSDNLEHLRGAILAATPVRNKDVSLSRAINSERAAMKADVRRLLDQVEHAEAEREDLLRALLRESGQRGIESAIRRVKRLQRFIANWRSEITAAVDSIQAVEATYNEKMKLQAAVKYWTDKARQHETAEGTARTRLYWYFPLSFLTIIIMFSAVFAVLLAPRDAKLDSAVYYVITAGLASAIGLLLWVGRLLTKLYLSEHHLRHDAEERAVMTTTYLALTAEQAASDPDRQIVLNALFRTTSDGIVKEDGGLDPSISAPLAKYLAR